MEKAIVVRFGKWLLPIALVGLACGKSENPTLVFRSTRYTLTAYPGKTTTHVELANKSERPQVVDLTTSCGCMSVAGDFTKFTLAPGQVVRVPVLVSLEKDDDTKQLIIASSQGTRVTTMVDVHVKWPIEIDHSQINLGSVDISRSDGARKELVLKVDKGVKNVCLRSLSPIVELTSVQRGDELSVSARLDEAAPLGENNVPVELSFQTSTQRAKAILPLKVTVMAEQFFEPTLVSFGVVKLRNRADRSAVFKSQTSLEGIKVASSDPSLSVKVVKEGLNSRTLELSWRPTKTGSLNSHVHVILPSGAVKRLAVSGFAVE